MKFNVQHLVDQFAINPSLEIEAADIILEELYKETQDRDFSEFIERAVEIGLLDSHLEEAVEHHYMKLDDAIQRAKFGGRYRYKGLTILMDRYFLKDSDGTFLENPAYFYMRVALGCYKAWDLTKEETIEHVLELFDDLQSFRFCNSTPTLFNAGKTKSQLSSCFLGAMGDSAEEILDSAKESGLLSKAAGGLAVYLGLLRGNGAPIKGVVGKASGTIKYAKLNETVAYCFDQEGKRKGALCNYLDIWHPDIEMFLDLRNETGDPRMRTPDANTAVCIPDLFMRKVESDSDFILFDPYCVPLHSVWGQEFDDMYYKAQLDFIAGKIPGRRVSAKALWRKLCERYVATGHPFIVFRDTMNRAFGEENIKQFGIIRSSNLCTEITQPSNPGYTTSCNLGSLNLVAFWDNDSNTFDFNKLENTVRNAIYALNAVIDSNWNPVEIIDIISKNARFIGLGTMAWADLAQVMKIPFDSEEFGNIQAAISGLIYETADETSRELLADVRYRWMFESSEDSRERLNPLMLATAPTATISKIIGVSSGRDPTFANIFSDENLSGVFATMNYHLVNDLQERGLWNDKVLQDIIANEGSIQNLGYIPDDVKRLYRTAFEMDQIQLVKNTAKCQRWICQSQSHNVYLKSRKGKDISDIIMTAWKEDVKTLYYCRTPAASAIEAVKATNMGDMNTACIYEPGKAPPDCEACQ